MVRIAIVLQGDPTDQQAWSGIPAGIGSGFEAAGIETVPIDARLPGTGKLANALRMSWVDQAASPVLAATGGLSANVALRAAGRIDGAVKIGSGYSLSGRIPYVTYEDMTVVQALAQPGDTYDSLSESKAAGWRARQARIYRSSRGCCAASSWAARSIRDDYGIAEERIHVVGFGQNFEPRHVDRDWSVPHFIFAGRDWKRKRGDAVVRAFAEVRDRLPEASLDLVGGHPAIDEPGVECHGVLSLDSRADRQRLESLLARATCMVLPSEYEPFGIAYLDAAASGIPSIGTTIGGALEAIGDGGRLVDPGDSSALTSAMLELSDPGTAERLGELAIARIPIFTWRAVAERLLRALRLPAIENDSLSPFIKLSGVDPARAG